MRPLKQSVQDFAFWLALRIQFSRLFYNLVLEREDWYVISWFQELGLCEKYKMYKLLQDQLPSKSLKM